MGEETSTNTLKLKYNPKVNKDSVKVAEDYLTNLIKKSKNREFFYNTNVFLTNDLNKTSKTQVYNKNLLKDWSDVNFYVQGFAFCPAYNYEKLECFIKTKRPGINIFNTNLSDSELKHTITHELAHLFDYYYGSNHSDDIVKKISDMNIDDENVYDNLTAEYENICDLSDSEEFKKAWKTDVENLGKLEDKERKNSENKLGYSNPTNYSNIDITDGISDEEMDLADTDRGETFAQLFSYALGNTALGGEDEEFTKNIFKNTYEVVKNYIEEFLGIECE